MWTTVLLLAIAVNFEPTRIGLVPMLLARDRPMLQLLAYLAGSLTVNLGFGLLILFVFHRNPFGTSSSNGGKAQIAVGVLALLVAAFMAGRFMLARRTKVTADLTGGGQDAQNGKQRAVDRFTSTVRNILRKGRSPWFAGLVGVGVGLPSVDYLAVLIIIGTSQRSQPEQAAALLTFVLLGSLVVMIPLIGYLIAPAKTLDVIERFAAWTRSRSQIEYAGLLALIGFLLVGLGIAHL